MNRMEFNELDLLQIGNTFEIAGVVYAKPDNEGVLILLPNEDEFADHGLSQLKPTLEEWQAIVRQSDLKEVELVGGDKNKKIILRKSTRQIEQSVMWEVFRRDNYTCRYCGNNHVPMTVDHVVLWEEGGPSIVQNLICSCKKCNNTRGSMQYEDWLDSPAYLSKSKILSTVDIVRNQFVAKSIPEIRKNHMRVNKRNR